MSEVEFHEPAYGSPAPATRKESALSRLVMKLGLASDEKGAQRVLLVVALAAIAAAVAFALSSGSSGLPESPLAPSV